nr:integrase, catalytic region, zinc finger, CCHC-type, peptidase aspartic, catalytic [Tanacetum cinerariifolium]
MKERASWDLGTGSHGVLGEVDGTIQVDAGVRERAVGEKGFWAGKLVRGGLLASTALGTKTTFNSTSLSTDTDEEIDEQELEAHYSYMEKIQEVPTADTCTHSEPLEQDMEILIQTCLMPLALKTQNDSFIFLHELKQEMHADLKYVESLEKEIDKLESDKAEFSNMYDMILQECVSNEVKCSYLLSLSDLDALAELQCLYIHKVKECDCLAQKLSKQTEFVSKEVHIELLQRFAKVEKHSISIEIALQKCKEQENRLLFQILLREDIFQRQSQFPKLMSQKVYQNQSLHRLYLKWQGKLTSNVNAVCATCEKCLVDSDHFACVTEMLNDVNARTKKPNIIQLILLIIDSGCTKHMTRNLKLLCNFVKKYMGAIRFGNDQFAPIIGNGDLVQRNITINRVYYVEGINHNLFSVGQFCDADLEIAFWKSTCFVRDL